MEGDRLERSRSWPLVGALRLEDGVLSAWALALPTVSTWFGLTGADSADRGPSPLLGLVELVAIAGAFAALLTRPSDQPPVRLGDRDAPRCIIAGPLIGGLAFASNSALENLGWRSGDWIIALAFLAILVGALASHRLPVVPADVRRAFVLPFTLVCAAYFNSFAAVFLEGLDIRAAFDAAPAAGTGFAIFILGFVLAGMAAFYAMFVVAPRELADPEDSGVRWAIRFASFVGSSLLGVGWLGLIGS
jgi:hypothetical protein